MALQPPHTNLISQHMLEDQEHAKRKGKNAEINCMGCGHGLRHDHTGVICVGDCHICPDCSSNYVNTIFEDPAKHIPLKCMLCKGEVIEETFERQLNEKQAQTFLLYHLKYATHFGANEILVACPFCPYFEINTDDDGRLLFLCQRDGCRKISCFWCKKSIQNNSDQDENKIDMDQADVESHFECAQLSPYKQKWDKALSDGNTRACPGCGIRGMKNNACTHMTCVKCHMEWCYVCGLSINDVDKANGFAQNNIFGHNQDWKTDPNRCPMWLNNIHEVDSMWPRDDSDGCVTFLHRLRTMELLKAVVNEMGSDNYSKICRRYKVDTTCGFDLNNVLNNDHTLIQRVTPIDFSGTWVLKSSSKSIDEYYRSEGWGYVTRTMAPLVSIKQIIVQKRNELTVTMIVGPRGTLVTETTVHYIDSDKETFTNDKGWPMQNVTKWNKDKTQLFSDIYRTNNPEHTYTQVRTLSVLSDDKMIETVTNCHGKELIRNYERAY
eukprot:796554_1